MIETTQLKLNFRSSIRRGTGEAYLLILENPKIDFSDDIIKASVKNFAYDGQCESSRAPYLYQIISLSSKREKIRRAILDVLATEKNDTWSLTQLFELAKIFAKDGDQAARNAIYDRFLTNPINGSDWVGYPEILELDGFDGLKFIAEKMGQALENDADDWQDDSIINYYERNNPELDVMQALDEAGVNNRFIKAYIENIKYNIKSREKNKRKKNVYKDIIDEILSSRLHYRRAVRKLTEDELEFIAQKLLTENKVSNREKLLSVFGKAKYPFDAQFILKLAQNKRQSKAKELAIDALQFLSSNAIREFALERIHESKDPGALVRILKSNYKKGDEKMLADLIRGFKSENVIESLAISYIDIYKKNITKECKEPLEAVYDKLTCAIHRKDIVEILLQNQVISEKIKREIKFDCDDEIRQLL